MIVLLLAATHDAGRLDIMPKGELQLRVERGLTLGDPDNDHILSVLAQADKLVRHMVDRVHDGYVAAGATRQSSSLASLKELVNDPPGR